MSVASGEPVDSPRVAIFASCRVATSTTIMPTIAFQTRVRAFAWLTLVAKPSPARRIPLPKVSIRCFHIGAHLL